MIDIYLIGSKSESGSNPRVVQFFYHTKGRAEVIVTIELSEPILLIVEGAEIRAGGSSMLAGIPGSVGHTMPGLAKSHKAMSMFTLSLFLSLFSISSMK